MIKFTYTVRDKNGIHARPAGALMNCAKKYTSDVTVTLSREGETGLRKADAKRLLSIMGLGARLGDVLEFTVSGVDENEAAAEIERVLHSI